VHDGIGPQGLDQFKHRIAVADVHVVVGVLRQFAAQLVAVPQRVTLRAEEHRPLVVIQAVDGSPLPVEKPADFRTDQSRGASDEYLHLRPSLWHPCRR
jgi:hypothetical protein